MSFYRSIGKRALDIALSAAGLLVTLPLIALLAVIIRSTLGAPVLFSQERPGRGGRPFVLYKFRSMTQAQAPDGELMADEVRLTRLGAWLRRLSLDELPQLWNVLRGDMSLVGPRPLLMEYLPLYNARQVRRHEVRPGITGLAQVNGRNALSWEEKFELDVTYVERLSFVLDVRILALTLLKVIRRHGISQPGSATMPKFTGTPRDE